MIRVALHSNRETALAEARTAILVPARALEEPGHIRTLPSAPDSTAKHDLHQLSQLALFDFEDGELAPRLVADGEAIVCEAPEETAEIADGLVVLRDADGGPVVIAHESEPVRRLLSQAHRYCTRWIRLDVK